MMRTPSGDSEANTVRGSTSAGILGRNVSDEQRSVKIIGTEREQGNRHVRLHVLIPRAATFHCSVCFTLSDTESVGFVGARWDNWLLKATALMGSQPKLRNVH